MVLGFLWGFLAIRKYRLVAIFYKQIMELFQLIGNLDTEANESSKF